MPHGRDGSMYRVLKKKFPLNSFFVEQETPEGFEWFQIDQGGSSDSSKLIWNQFRIFKGPLFQKQII